MTSILAALAGSAVAAPPDAVLRADALEQEGRDNLRAGDYPAALARLRKAVVLRRQLADPAKEASTLNVLCLAHQRSGRFREAKVCYEEALTLVGSLERNEETTRLEASVLNNLGGIAANLGRPEEHRGYLLQALDLHVRASDTFGEGVARNNLGAFHRQAGEVGAALEQYEAALRIFEAENRPYWQARTHNNVGYAYLSIGETGRARDGFREALPLRRAAGDRAGETLTLLNLGRAFAADGDLGQATAFTGRALDAALAAKNPRLIATARRTLGSLHLERGAAGLARQELTTALASVRRMGLPGSEAKTLELLARVELAGGDAETALTHARKAAELLRAGDDPVALLRALTTLARAERTLRRPARARAHIEEALSRFRPVWDDLTDPLLRASFLAAQRALHEESVALWMDRHRAAPDAGYDRQALSAAEAARSRSLLALTDSDRGVPAPLDAGGVQGLLDGETILVEYFLASEASFAWVVARDRISTHELPPRNEIERRAEDVHRRLSAVHRRSHEDRVRLADLGRVLLEPLAEHRRGRPKALCRRLVVVADGALHFVPFAALPDPDTGEELVEGYKVVHAPSASVLAATRRDGTRTSDAPTVAIFADPIFTRDDPRLAVVPTSHAETDRTVPPAEIESLPRLPHSRREAEAVAALLPVGSRRVALGTDARRSRVLGDALATARIVHFATHAVADPRRPERSGLVLSRFDDTGRPLDGFLGFDDVATLDLNADLVVLSGCRTALGRPLAGEGLVGLTRAIQYAGVPRVVATLWPLRDAAGAELMERFYRALLADGLPAAAALRAAQRQVRRSPSLRDPYHWAAFTLQGDWR